MLFTALIITASLHLQSMATDSEVTFRSQSLQSGNWGQLSMMNSRQKCYGVNLAKTNQLYSYNCNSYDDKQLWRYDRNTHQLQNKGLTSTFGTPYCMAVSEPGERKNIYVRKCLGQIYNKFLVREDLGGTVQQFPIEMNIRYCIDIYGHSSSSDQPGKSDDCEAVTARNTDHWTLFHYRHKYNGGGLKPVRNEMISDGNWGSIVPRTTGSCFAVDAITNILEQRHCLPSDKGQMFRWNERTKELINYQYPRHLGTGKGCVTLGSRNTFYVQHCVGSINQKFILDNGVAFDGQFQQLRTYGDMRYCIGVYGGTRQGHQRIYRYTCDSRLSSSNDQWLGFTYWKSTKVCPGGQFLSGKTCKYCPANTYSQKGAIVCKQCPAGYTSPKGATKCTKINKCAAGSYMGQDEACKYCPINTFSNKIGSYKCTPCAAGFYTDSIGSTFCKRRAKCVPGTFVHANECWKCPINTFSNTYNAVKCTKCPAGFITDGSGSTSCKSIVTCNPGSFLHVGKCWKCPINTYSTTFNAAKCKKCPAGFITDGPGSTSCKSIVTCNPGSFLHVGKCWTCPINTYSTTFNAAKCTKCPAGFITDGPGSTSCKRKVDCAPGTYINKGGCWKCPKNTFTNTHNAAKCTRCPNRYDTETTGSKTCKLKTYCKAGKYHNGANCLDCPLNTFTNSVGNVRCQKCPAGQITLKIGSTFCTIDNNCNAGTFYNKFTKKCVKCPKNTYSAGKGRLSCTICPKGWETKGIGAVKCTKINFCKAGKFFSGKKCQNCPRNTYTNKIGSVKCIPCAAGYETKGTGSIVCTKITSCHPGTFFNGVICQACPINTYNNKHGAKWCTKCRKGWETKSVGALSCTKIPAKFEVVAVPQKTSIVCPYNVKSPPCTLFCRFRTSHGIAIKNIKSITFYKKVDKKWVKHGKVYYNRETDWFSMRVSTKPQERDTGTYKCEATYGGKVGSAELRVSLNVH